MEADTIRTNYPIFEYLRASWEHLDTQVLRFSWTFQIGSQHCFTPSLEIFDITADHINAIGQQTLNWYAFQLGLVEMISYWKTTTSPQINIRAGHLTPAEATWWHSLLVNGLGEFFYQNQIDFTSPTFVKIVSEGLELKPNSTPFSPTKNSVLIPVGGGKDSAVTLAILRQALLDQQLSKVATVVINPIQSAIDLATTSGLTMYRVERHLDPHLLEMNQTGFLNGHTPFSAMAAWVTTLVAHLLGFEYVAVSNERSSNEGNTIWHGQEINHQYSKTFHFERSFQAYIADHLSAPYYFSFLRPLYELQIGKLFSEVTEKGSAVRSRFRSCNRGQKTNSWCCDCPKCLFAYLILRPFIPHAEMVTLFGQDVLANQRLLPTLLELVGQLPTKPFECVGTHEESIVAVQLCIQQYQAENIPLPILLEKSISDFLPASGQEGRAFSVLKSWNDQHAIPFHLVDLLQQRIHG